MCKVITFDFGNDYYVKLFSQFNNGCLFYLLFVKQYIGGNYEFEIKTNQNKQSIYEI